MCLHIVNNRPRTGNGKCNTTKYIHMLEFVTSNLAHNKSIFMNWSSHATNSVYSFRGSLFEYFLLLYTLLATTFLSFRVRPIMLHWLLFSVDSLYSTTKLNTLSLLSLKSVVYRNHHEGMKATAWEVRPISTQSALDGHRYSRIFNFLFRSLAWFRSVIRMQIGIRNWRQHIICIHKCDVSFFSLAPWLRFNAKQCAIRVFTQNSSKCKLFTEFFLLLPIRIESKRTFFDYLKSDVIVIFLFEAGTCRIFFTSYWTRANLPCKLISTSIRHFPIWITNCGRIEWQKHAGDKKEPKLK